MVIESHLIIVLRADIFIKCKNTTVHRQRKLFHRFLQPWLWTDGSNCGLSHRWVFLLPLCRKNARSHLVYHEETSFCCVGAPSLRALEGLVPLWCSDNARASCLGKKLDRWKKQNKTKTGCGLESSKFGFVQQMIHSVFPLLFICTLSHIGCAKLPGASFISSVPKEEHSSEAGHPLVSINFNHYVQKQSFLLHITQYVTLFVTDM